MKFGDFPYTKILDWYKKNGRHSLPWRDNQDPYFVWISEIFLQQTQVSRVIPYFQRVVENFPTIHDFAKLSYEEFFPYYEGLGYYSRARNMLKTAQIISEKYNGVFPDNYKDLIDLPGIGPYTAQAILSFGHNQNILAFDTNIEKIFARYYYGSRFYKLTNQQKKEIQNGFENFCSPHLTSPNGRGINNSPLSLREETEVKATGRIINAAMMDFANSVDINEKNNIDWENYPLTESKFFQEKGISESKVDKVRHKIDKKDAEIIVFIHEEHKEYYSSNEDTLEPFILGKSQEDHRHFIKNYFKNNFDLSLSVRPAYKKVSLPKGDYFFYHAQIQTGQHEFGIFSKKEKKYWEDNFLET